MLFRSKIPIARHRTRRRPTAGTLPRRHLRILDRTRPRGIRRPRIPAAPINPMTLVHPTILRPRTATPVQATARKRRVPAGRNRQSPGEAATAAEIRAEARVTLPRAVAIKITAALIILPRPNSKNWNRMSTRPPVAPTPSPIVSTAYVAR